MWQTVDIVANGMYYVNMWQFVYIKLSTTKKAPAGAKEVREAVKIRITGTEEECRQFSAMLLSLREDGATVEVSTLYKNRPPSNLYRLYAELGKIPANSTIKLNRPEG